MITSTQTSYLNRSGEGRIAYDVRGTGPAIILVPGMGELRSSYRFLAPLLADAYPRRSDGTTFFPFRRIFVVAQVR